MSDISKMKNMTFPIPSFAEWKQEVEKSLKGKPFEKLYSTTYENITIKPIYTRRDIESLTHVEQYPGFPGYVRGTRPNGYIQEPWKVSQEISATSPQEWNEIVKHDLARGQTEIHIVLERLGFPVISLDDMEAMFSDISLDKYSLRVDAGAQSLSFLALFAAYLRKRQMPFAAVRGTIGMDPIGTLAETGHLSFSLASSYDVMADVAKWAKNNMPHVKTIIVRGEPYHNGGANAVQELAFAFATAVEYINACLDRGLAIDDVASQIQFSFAVGSNFFMEIAKLRAARLVWANIVQAFGGSESAQKIAMHARTSYFTKTIYDPYVNMLRAAAEAFAATIGGADSLHVSPFDEAIGPADEFSRRIARNTQLILLEEAHIANVIDPAGGSYYVETLTAQVAEKTWKLFQQIEGKGGIVKALQDGFVQAEVENVAKQRKDNVKKRKEKIVGTNFYANLAEAPIQKANKGSEKAFPFSKVDEENVAQLQAGFRENRWIETAIFMAVRRATAQEIEAALKADEASINVKPIQQWRLAESFEQLRKAAEVHLEKHGARPTVHLINIGSIPNYKTRADFITGFFEAGGVAVAKSEGYHTAEEAVSGALEANGTHYIICGSDESYTNMVPAIAKAFKQAKPNAKLYVAGKQPADVEQTFIEAGVDGFIHIGSNCYETIVSFMKEMGVALDE
ncbi:heterodimeric methylmalonyl-CoA mutase small subunit [Parageobacillus thermantarcticus]|uniref:methylmalonyl-CoA mutase n=1 Tax=Parageobacillus thermantarcticus TaxID=186116 RepID=A0A1I0T192_9BACL|nr:methylmalonyl-CoA mutase family protein [Parageobacillus thermantarcticus]SFA44796.1 heterodimeric methylmalonyl-CoA mutase small subunit [Parageobacillus thermantarcticus]